MTRNARVGKTGEYEPQRCAVTGQLVAGRHASHYHLKGGYYFAIMEKARMTMTEEDVETIRAELNHAMNASGSHKTRRPVKAAAEIQERE